MSDYINLLGAEDVQRAGRQMLEAANMIGMSVGSFDDILLQHRTWMDDWLARFEEAVRESRQPVRDDFRETEGD